MSNHTWAGYLNTWKYNTKIQFINLNCTTPQIQNKCLCDFWCTATNWKLTRRYQTKNHFNSSITNNRNYYSEMSWSLQEKFQKVLSTARRPIKVKVIEHQELLLTKTDCDILLCYWNGWYDGSGGGWAVLSICWYSCRHLLRSCLNCLFKDCIELAFNMHSVLIY